MSDPPENHRCLSVCGAAHAYAAIGGAATKYFKIIYVFIVLIYEHKNILTLVSFSIKTSQFWIFPFKRDCALVTCDWDLIIIPPTKIISLEFDSTDKHSNPLASSR